MDRSFHKTETFYNTDKVNEKIGFDRDHYTYDKIEIFIDRFSKKIGFAVITYDSYENGKKTVKQLIPYIETENDLKDIIHKSFAKEKKIHYVDLSYTYLVSHKYDDRKNRKKVDIKCVEYTDNEPHKESYEILEDGVGEILRVLENYHKNDPRINRRFDGYTKEPIPKPEWRIRQEEKLKKQANSMPMPEPTVSQLVLGEVKAHAEDLKKYVLLRLGLNKPKAEIRQPEELRYRHKSR